MSRVCAGQMIITAYVLITMMTKFKLLLLATVVPFSVISCDSDNKDKTTTEETNQVTPGSTIGKVGNIDPALQVYLDTFIQEATVRGHDVNLFNLNMVFKQLEEDVLGVCGHDANAAYVDISDTLRSGDPEFTVLHELGHCLLGMDHRDAQLSIMNTFESDAALRAVDRKALFDELFQEKFFFPNVPE